MKISLPSLPLQLLLLALPAAGEYTIFTEQKQHGPFSPRAIPAGGLFNGTFFVMGGRNHIVHFESDVWRSRDALNWVRASASAPWGARGYMDTVFTKNGTMVLIGGQDLFKCYSDVWHSYDAGSSWVKVADDAPWGLGRNGSRQGRSAYKTLVLEDDTILLFSGDYGSFFNRGFYADVWASTDAGRTWVLRFDASALPAGTPTWAPRAGMQVVKVGQTILFMGGDNDQYAKASYKRFGDIWRSDDLGASWHFVTMAPWGNRTGHQCFESDGCVYCVGGQGNPACNAGKNFLYHDVWKTCDLASSWKQVANNAFGCDASAACGTEAGNCGADDFLTRKADDGKVWLIAGDQEKEAPFPMSNQIWTLEDDGKQAAEGQFLV